MTAANVLWCFNDLQQHHDDVLLIQAIRMASEARGGFCGATGGTAAGCLVH